MNKLSAELSQTLIVPITCNGLHRIGDWHSAKKELLEDFTPFRNFINGEIEKLSLSKVGEVYHNFAAGGFTAVVCLSESHLSIHTWPERDYITFDVFLSNFLRDNSAATEHLYQKTAAFFGASIISDNSLSR